MSRDIFHKWFHDSFIPIVCKELESLGHEKKAVLKSIRVHFAPAEIAITLELLSQFLSFLDQNDLHSLGVLLIY